MKDEKEEEEEKEEKRKKPSVFLLRGETTL